METLSLVFLFLLALVVAGYFMYTEYGLESLHTTWGVPSWRVLRNWWWGPSDYVIYDTDPYDRIWTRGPDRQTKWYEWRKMSEAIENLAQSNREIAQRMQPPPPPSSPPPAPPVS